MKVVRKREFRTSPWRKESIEVTMTVGDLPPHLMSPKVINGEANMFLPTILELLADRAILVAMGRQGALHRNSKKNKEETANQIATIDNLIEAMRAMLVAG